MAVRTGFLTLDTVKTFSLIHSDFFKEKREFDLEIVNKRFLKRSILGSNWKNQPTNEEETLCQPLIYKALSLLLNYGYFDYDPTSVTVEFQRRNYLNIGKKKQRQKDLIWHFDDFSIEPWRVYTVIFYLRKDKTINGGNFEYEENGREHIIDVDRGMYLILPGYINHTPQHGYGFGCRDSIVVFVKKK